MRTNKAEKLNQVEETKTESPKGAKANIGRARGNLAQSTASADPSDTLVDSLIAEGQAMVRLAEALKGVPASVASSVVRHFGQKLSASAGSHIPTPTAGVLPTPVRMGRPRKLTDDERREKAAAYQRAYRAKKASAKAKK